MENDQWLNASAETALRNIHQEINSREAKAAELVELIKSTNVEEWDLDLIERVYDLMRGSCSERFSLAGVYQMGVIYGERKRREAV